MTRSSWAVPRPHASASARMNEIHQATPQRIARTATQPSAPPKNPKSTTRNANQPSTPLRTASQPPMHAVAKQQGYHLQPIAITYPRRKTATPGMIPMRLLIPAYPKPGYQEMPPRFCYSSAISALINRILDKFVRHLFLVLPSMYTMICLLLRQLLEAGCRLIPGNPLTTEEMHGHEVSFVYPAHRPIKVMMEL